MALLTKTADGPKDKAKDCAEQDGGGEGEGDGPATASPVEIAGEVAEGQMQAAETDNDQAGKEQQTAEEDQDSAEIIHFNPPREERIQALASMAAASRRRSSGLHGLVRIPMGRLSLLACSRTLGRLE